MNQSSKTWGIAVVALAIVILIGAYFLFQQGPVPMETPETASSTAETASTTGDDMSASSTASMPSDSGAATVTEGNSGAVAAPAPAKSAFTFDLDTVNATIGGTLPPITVHLPPGSDGKVIEIAIQPAGSTAVPPKDVLIAAPINTANATYAISGVSLATATDGTTGKEVALTPGTYEIEIVIWDRSPFTADNRYGDLSANNANAVVSAPFALSQ